MVNFGKGGPRISVWKPLHESTSHRQQKKIYLHSNDGIDEEEHRYEKSHVWKSLRDKTQQCWTFTQIKRYIHVYNNTHVITRILLLCKTHNVFSGTFLATWSNVFSIVSSKFIILKWSHWSIAMNYFRSLWNKISAPEKIWWKSIRAFECPRLCSTASPTAWHETNGRMWWRFWRCPPCSDKTHQHMLMRQKHDVHALCSKEYQWSPSSHVSSHILKWTYKLHKSNSSKMIT